MKGKKIWQWLICILFVGIVCMLPTDTAKAAVQYGYQFNEKEHAYYISYVDEVAKNSTITLPSSYNGYPVVGIMSSAFYGEPVKKVIVPVGYTSIDNSAFFSCPNLQEVVIYGQIKTLKNNSFAYCPKLTKVTLPSSLKTIEEGVFYGSSIKTITLPKSVKTIKDYAFNGCTKLYQIIFKGNSVSIGDYTFQNILPDKVTFVAKKGSDAYVYAQAKGFPVSESTKFKVSLKGNKMFVGEKKQLQILNNPYTVKWSTSKKSVVAIDKEGYITAKKSGTATITAKINKKSYKYKITVVKRTEKNVLNIVWSNYVTKGMTDYEKVVAANKFLAQNVKYDYDNYLKGTIPYVSHTATGALQKGVAVCDGYTKAFIEIIDHYGIPVKMVVGTGNGGGHAWNLVKIGTRWYHVDVTWNDPVGDSLDWDYYNTNYLLISNNKMDDDHKWSKKSYPTASAKTPDKKVTTVTASGIKLSSISENLYVGKTATIKVTGTSKKVTWSSSNKKIATVSSKGKITAKKAGTAKIYCKVNGKKYTINVTVKDPYLNETKVTMTKGGSTLTLKLTGATVKKYSSSKSSVVTVSKKGVLTAKKAGTATISVKASNGKTYKCAVTVKAYSLNATKKTVNVGEKYQLSVKGLAKNTPIKWKSSNWKVAKVDASGKVTALAKGTATISATVGGATYKCTITAHQHSNVWSAESNECGAKAKYACTTCGKMIKEGVQLVDSVGNKYYGTWHPEIVGIDVLDYYNKKLVDEGYQAMVWDATMETELMDYLCEVMRTNPEPLKGSCISSDADTNVRLYATTYGDDFTYYLDYFYSWVNQEQYGLEREYEHRFAMIPFIWDVYGNGSTLSYIYVMDSEIQILE